MCRFLVMKNQKPKTKNFKEKPTNKCGCLRAKIKASGDI